LPHPARAKTLDLLVSKAIHPRIIEAASCSELVELPGERADMAPDGGAEHEVAVRGADPQEKEREPLAEKQRIGANINIKKRAHLLGHRS
jgi:hypothetical protein